MITRAGRLLYVMAFTVAGDKIVRIDVVLGTDRVRRLASAVLSQPD